MRHCCLAQVLNNTQAWPLLRSASIENKELFISKTLHRVVAGLCAQRVRPSGNVRHVRASDVQACKETRACRG